MRWAGRYRIVSDLDEIVGAGVPQRVGSFQFFLDGHRWEWSDTVAAIHGYTPGQIIPTTELLLSHKHPDDHPQVAALFDKMIADGQPFSSRHRILDTTGQVHHVLVVGDRMLDEHDQVLGTSGFYIDVTDLRDWDRRDMVDEIVVELEKSRAVIEQAKGVLMLAYTITADRAFDILTWHSQQTNTKLRTVAELLVATITTTTVLPDHVRARFDHLLLTSHRPDHG
ncbi:MULTISPECIES: PAS and ANTAR domain-containing protein [Rhodococcus]|uniref:histidine kinase n=1 Tax=Rhodococcus oxybenzonivorans TaxID=1990687 RepID=A0AAE4UYS0_9NOCA|nr:MULTISPECIES: PAS and ANTAR domain-containing protein [Rhodococcus]MDV7241741.1 PAS and ANTAR domain-containing protein [Rhodococcus oxybenzonivorans]MDV7264648.1 PAS and ANTAR domain-containing protein [Rhodococcus oxybenzonivorans]MDV7273725.1 PAS and ANTAR domain-containing protein [Rhodococcus oxybenzonivorans]MDV7334023.1 PAS and ANTAR domain-containing protein [Rhodococcus oxybenzonivorans]MDV7343442.1 PAS and ANTAR domain-containing protein [Rhodococcus oxybenzonivorans]